VPDQNDLEYDRPEDTLKVDVARELGQKPERSNAGTMVAVVIAIVGLALLGLWYASRRVVPPPATVATPAQTAPAAAPATASTASALPALADSDALVRELVAGLSSNSRLARWLVSDDLVRRFVASVVNVAEGTSPRSHLGDLSPAASFTIRKSGDRQVVDPLAFGRWNVATEVFVSIDAQGAGALFHKLHPLFDQAYAEVGDPTSTFDATLERALGRLVTTPLPQPPYRVVPQGVVWAWADHGLEGRTSAEKQLMRLGPDNARRVQAKLRELAEAAGLSPTGGEI
jgi:Protein of unknown function (DUF3014)